ncbi:MAG: TIGR03790 family protein [Gammaproteobacteria bacterium]
MKTADGPVISLSTLSRQGPRGRSGQLLFTLLLFSLMLLPACDAIEDTDTLDVPVSSTLGPQHLALIINDEDPLSRRIGEYYLTKRHIPASNVIHVKFKPGNNVMRPQTFRLIKAQLDAQVPASVQGYVLTWTAPYRVGCMSITTAFAAGFDEAFCVQGCKATRPSPYFNSNSQRPFTDVNWRPAMMLAGETFAAVKALIDRGVAADSTHPDGSAYLLSTSDRARNARARFYHGIDLLQTDRFKVEVIEGNSLQHRSDVMFYFTGLVHVEGIDSNQYLPGAIADHLTSTGGKLTGSSQMSSLRWLQAGATGSYGAVVEPCAFVQKFPRPNIVIDRYLNGETLLEAYWKSVEWPGQGVFIGEPLAAPFR